MPERVLLIRPSALGDVARTVPLLVSMARAWPGAKVDWLVNAELVDAVRCHPDLHEVVPFERRLLSRFGRRTEATRAGLDLRRRLRSARYDLVIDAQGLARSGLLTYLTAAPRRVGLADAREAGWMGYNVRHAVDPSITHTVDRMLALIRAEGVPPIPDMTLHTDPADRALLEGLPRDYVCLAPTAKWGCKCWPIDGYTTIAQRFIERGMPVVVLAGPSEKEKVKPLTELRDGVFQPRTTVGQMMTLIQHARGIVCNDSAPLHMAVGFDRPIVGLFGPTDPEHVGPYRRRDTVIQPPELPDAPFDYRKHRDDNTLIAAIPVETVWQRVEPWLDAKAKDAQPGDID